MVGESNRSIQVLNISNVNAQGKTVLNDGKLLELILKYPFIYNPRIKAFNDPDYGAWAWKNINAEFNRSYANDPNAAFSTQDLINRWQILKPLIQCLSKAYDLEAIPQSLRLSVIKISSELEDQSTNVLMKPNTHSQQFLMDQILNIAELSVDKKLALEKDILDLLLTSEFESKHITKLDEAAWKEIDEQTDDFLNRIGFKQVLLTSLKRQENIINPNNTNQHSLKSYVKPKKKNNWVPLPEAHKFIKSCNVRVMRVNMEDYLPLAKIIKTKRKRKHR